MNFTLFGYPKTGKTTLFNLLTGAKIEVKAYEEGKKEPVLRTCPVPDPRLEKIWALYPDKKKIPATIDFTDLGGISFGEVKNSAYLSHLREADGLTHVVRGFSDVQIPHPKGKISPEDDIRSMEEELILADLILVETRLDKLEKELTGKKSPEGEKERELLRSLRSDLDEGKGIREASFSPQEEKSLRSFEFLSQKPLLHVVNVDEQDTSLIENLSQFYPAPKEGIQLLAFCGKIEAEIMELEDEERETFLAEYGLKELSILKFLKASYDLLKALTFFTIGKGEVKAWTIRENTPASQAAGAIHTDIEKGFIKAEVIPWEELLQHGSFQTAKEKGAVRLEGKDYLVQDGDVIYFRFAT
ncbi:MAG: redox-regulated ATPase YchF [Candidatus Aminicenantes bacterium]|nr:redox-regulated ATPase YchF [Candidatus Aminicenantes bacterium]